jgi:hypothetical protein
MEQVFCGYRITYHIGERVCASARNPSVRDGSRPDGGTRGPVAHTAKRLWKATACDIYEGTSQQGDADMCTVLPWTLEHLDRILALIAIVVAAYAIWDVRKLFKELERRDQSTETRIRQEMLTHFASHATFAYASQFIDFIDGELGPEASIALLQAFHTQKLLAPKATKEELNALQKLTREQVGKEAVEWARLIVASGGGTMKPDWDLPPKQ